MLLLMLGGTGFVGRAVVDASPDSDGDSASAKRGGELAAAQNFTGPGALKGVSIRADVLNLFDKKYQIRSGEGVGVGAPQWDQRRGFFAGVTKAF